MGVMEARRHKKFMTRTCQMYSNLRARLRKGGDSEKALPFPIDMLRAAVTTALNHLCPYCGCRLTVSNFSVDHATPISRGGSWEGTNLHIVCLSCNKAKGEMTTDEFIKLVALLKEFEPSVFRDVFGRLKAGAAVKRLRFLRR